MHCWPQAPGEVSFLREPHRHVFHIEATAQVFHNDREIEFITMKRRIQNLMRAHPNPSRMGSCEQIATFICDYLVHAYGVHRMYSVRVSEDGENGAAVIYDASK